MKKTKPASPKLSLTPPKPAGQMRRTQTVGPEPPTVIDEASLLADLRALIQSARQRVATVANATQTLLYWHVGRRLLKENLQDGRAAYGKRILATVSRELALEFGRGFNYAAVNRMIQSIEERQGGHLLRDHQPPRRTHDTRRVRGEKVGEKVGESLTPNQKRILSLLRQNTRLSARELAEKVGISSRKIEQNIAKLKESGSLRRIGPAKGGYWEVLK